MRRSWFCLAAFTTAAVLPTAAAQPPVTWATLKGQIVLPDGNPIPARPELNVNQDKAHCLAKGPILDETVIVNPKNRGVKNVVVWLRPDNVNPKAAFAPNEIRPDDGKRKAAVVDIDQPCCMFVARVTAARVGDTIRVKNSAPVTHNFFWTSLNNGDHNPVIAANGEFKFPNPLVAESAPIQYKCTIHPWMGGYARIFEHPYYAVTDDDGTFTIPNAPAGKYRMVVWHEKAGFLGGKEGRFGTPVQIAGPATELPAQPFVGLK
jgi:plastocyanin